ncbi:transposase [Thermomonas sp.]|jgi:transposase|uniref:transposase n=1 Tax=Thermomonas sp. TaxID=1971895 RepID=UPI001ACCD9DB|nr:transposase [Xanthomonadales bacterium]MBN8767861.1 transposase [Stenotrophomonas sp.]
MSDAMAELFTAALGLSAPWRVKAVRFAPSASELHFDVTCEATRLPAIKRLAKTFQAHRDGLRNMLTHANSNAAAESINADIQGAIARARGFRPFATCAPSSTC